MLAPRRSSLRLAAAGGVAALLALAPQSAWALGPGPDDAAATTAAAPTVSIADPDATTAPRAGSVELHGSTAAGLLSQNTTVEFVVDVSASTSSVSSKDCDGNGKVDAGDDLNGDGSVGDILDCEIGAVIALNHSLAAVSPDVATLRVGLTAFSKTAATASVAADGGQFVAPGDATGASEPRMQVVARSLKRHVIGAYTPTTVEGGTDFDAAVTTALGALATVQGGQKWIMFISDGEATAHDLATLKASGVHLRSFAVGADSSCATGGSLAKMADATGEACLYAASPASLKTQVVTAKPAAVAGVTVTVGTRTVAAAVDPLGGWSAKLGLVAGTYTATATATSTSGRTARASRTFTVAAAPAPVAGMTPGTGLPATALRVATPAPSKTALPAVVRGTATARDAGAVVATDGMTVRLQAESKGRTTWATVATAKVRKGAFALTWKPANRAVRLRVVLPSQSGLPAAVRAVPHPVLSSCTVVHVRAGHAPAHWAWSCRTTARKGSKATLLDGRRHVVATGVVRQGRVVLSTRAHLGHPTLRVATGRHTVGLRF
ncbi:hypothetical protein CLV35_3133 [Motilibacter peucedani]|uniref:VWFA domain-containing protein n=1 Tax=Motilibacter peucedani TaxID=598650 RepID=A0A420XLE4_9ACTN|nr:VWA domain-containing protein [Motilibacter peucedani]RKS71337.1 hypothetical protein CLV35_3133 [Motilibacter peucedani]